MTEFTKDDAKRLEAFIERHDFFYIIGHKDPDGDCIASCLGIAEIVNYLNKPYQLLSAGPFKRNEIKRFENYFSPEMKFLSETERQKTGLLIADCSELSRLGDIDGDLKNLDTFIIDHHKTSETPSGFESFIDPSSPACAYLIQLFYETICGPVPKNLAEILFFGLCTDTGFFRFLEDNSSSVFEAASRLIKSGANPRTTYKKINDGKPYSTRKLLGILLSRTELYLNGRLAITYETMSDTKQYGQEGRDSDALYQLMLSSEGVEAVVFLRQETDTNCTGGFRSQDKIDVSIVASKFGGGGHKNASGMCTEGKIDTLIPAIVKEFARIM